MGQNHESIITHFSSTVVVKRKDFY